MIFLKKKFINYFLISIFFIIGSIIAIDRGSNFSDGDSFGVILSFLNYLENGIYTPSRGGYGHPIPEFFIGSLSYLLGTPYSNFFCFITFFFSILFFFKTFINKQEKILLFFLLILSNFFLFFENTNSIDYPIALFFFSLGLFFLKNNKIVISSIFFGLAIASRANFLTFVYPIIFIGFFEEILNKKISKFITSLLITTLVGIIFYYPLFKINNFTLGFLDIPFLTQSDDRIGWYGGPALTIESLLPRFIFKIYKIIGVFSVFLIILFSKEILKKFNFKKKENIFLLWVIFINLFIFFFMPTKMLIINPFLIFFYIIIFKYLDSKKIIFLIFFNFLNWFISYDLIDIKYKNQEICFAKEAISATFSFSIKKGEFINYISSKKNLSECYSQFMGKYSNEFEKEIPLRLSN